MGILRYGAYRFIRNRRLPSRQDWTVVMTACRDGTHSCQASAEHFQQCAEFPPLRDRGVRVFGQCVSRRHEVGLQKALSLSKSEVFFGCPRQRLTGCKIVPLPPD